MNYRFEKGQTYIGTSTLDNKRQKAFVVIGRRGNVVQFVQAKDVIRGTVVNLCGVECFTFKNDDGFDYVMSARATVDLGEAFHVVDLCR